MVTKKTKKNHHVRMSKSMVIHRTTMSEELKAYCKSEDERQSESQSECE